MIKLQTLNLRVWNLP